MNPQTNGTTVDSSPSEALTLHQLTEELQKLMATIQQLTTERDRLRIQLEKTTAESEGYRKCCQYYLAQANPMTEEELLAIIAESDRNPGGVEELNRIIEELEGSSQ